MGRGRASAGARRRPRRPVVVPDPLVAPGPAATTASNGAAPGVSKRPTGRCPAASGDRPGVARGQQVRQLGLVAGSVSPRLNTGRSTSRKIPIGVGAVGVSASFASENARPGSVRVRIVDEQRSDSSTSATSTIARHPSAPRTTPRSSATPNRIGWPASRRIWLSVLDLLVGQRRERAVVEHRTVLVDLDQRGALVGRGRAQHLGQVMAVAVDRPRHERRLGAERQRDRVERMVGDAERRRLGDLAQLGGRRRLALGQPVDLVVEQQDLHRDVAPQRVDQMVAADREESPSPLTTQIERSSRAVASPVASAGARPWIPCIP